MVPVSSEHDTSAKTVMGYSAPAGLSAMDDLNGILGYLANHPNTAPFISKQLIQHMVKSNPTPQYVLRVEERLHPEQRGHADRDHGYTARPRSAR